MSPSILACGPFFSAEGFFLSIAVLLFFKPLAYYAFVQAFRYRVSRPIPMTTGQAAKIAGIRAGLGFLFVSIGAGLLMLLARANLFDGRFLDAISWLYLYGERLAVWTWLGAAVAGLKGRRLVGWTLSGTGLNAVFDFAVVAGLFSGVGWPLAIFCGIAAFIAVLHQVGRRDSLKARFSHDPLCQTCGYNLTGNLSGICPECGTAISIVGDVAAR